jgi:hypothetical protein
MLALPNPVAAGRTGLAMVLKAPRLSPAGMLAVLFTGPFRIAGSKTQTESLQQQRCCGHKCRRLERGTGEAGSIRKEAPAMNLPTCRQPGPAVGMGLQAQLVLLLVMALNGTVKERFLSQP